MNTCGTCKYFGAGPERTDRDEMEEWGPYKVCGFLEMATYRCELTEGIVAYLKDASGYYAALCVSQDFGCNQWVTKEPAEEKTVTGFIQ